jgi:hypothetical protein
LAIDTLAISKRLRDAGVSEPQADAFAEIIREVRADDFKLLATKGDLEALRLAMKGDLDTVRLATKADMAELKSDLTVRVLAIIGLMNGLLFGLIKLT